MKIFRPEQLPEDTVRCPVCDERVQIVFQSPEEEIHCSQCGSVHTREKGGRWEYAGSAYPWRSQTLET